jgi:hypothetical protein
MARRTINDERDNLHVAVWVAAKATVRLYQVVVQHAQNPETGWPAAPLGKGEVEA